MIRSEVDGNQGAIFRYRQFGYENISPEFLIPIMEKIRELPPLVILILERQLRGHPAQPSS